MWSRRKWWILYSKKVVDAARAKLETAYGMPLVEHTWGQVEDFEYRLKDVSWDELGMPSRPLSEEEELFIWNERNLSKVDFRYFIERYARILTDEKRIEPLRPWPSQEKLLEALAEEEDRWKNKTRIILLKSRQVGGTVIAEAIIAHMVMMNPNTQAVVASDHPDNTLKLYQTLDRLYKNMPPWLKPLRDGNVKGNHMRFSVLDSDVIFGAGNQKTTLGQGMNVDAVHLTEVSTWLYPGYIDEDLMPAFDSSRKHHSTVILESTGAGAKLNWFHDQFQIAVQKKSLFRPVFIAWYLRPGWSMDPTGFEFTKETLNMASRVKRETGIDLKKEQLAWFQMKRTELDAKGKLGIFYQEFPSTIEEAFQTGLDSVFTIDLRAKMRDKTREPIFVASVNFEEQKLKAIPKWEWPEWSDEDAVLDKLFVWEWARPGFLYVVGVDASYGHAGKDNASIQVLRVGNKYEPDEQVAEWTGTCSPLDLAVPAWILGNVFADKIESFPAKMVVEVNPGAPGIVTQLELIRRRYPHFYVWRKPTQNVGTVTKELGWWTTPATRPLLTEMGVDFLRKGNVLINSPAFIHEMNSFVNIPDARGRRHLTHADGYHDDRIMSLFMALYVAHEYDTLNVADDRRKTQEFRDNPPAKEGRDFQALGLTWEECMRKWEEEMGLD